MGKSKEDIYSELFKSIIETKMTLFEVMTGISVTLAIAIPTFMDKVMRPKYEGRFSEFRKQRREVFIEEFEDALRQLKKAKENLYWLWNVRVKTNISNGEKHVLRPQEQKTGTKYI